MHSKENLIMKIKEGAFFATALSFTDEQCLAEESAQSQRGTSSLHRRGVPSSLV